MFVVRCVVRILLQIKGLECHCKTEVFIFGLFICQGLRGLFLGGLVSLQDGDVLLEIGPHKVGFLLLEILSRSEVFD